MFARRSFWYMWAGGTAVWVALILVLVPDVRRGDFSWDALTSSQPSLLSHTSCGSIMDPLAARTCAAIERGARERRTMIREQRFRATMATLGILFGPPLLILLVVYISDAAVPDGPRRQRRAARR